METKTSGSKCMAAWTAMEEIMDIWLTLCYLEVPIKGVTYLLKKDASTVVDSSKFLCSINNTKCNHGHSCQTSMFDPYSFDN